MKNKIVLLLVFLVLPCMAFAQYRDHRTYFREIDSLEQILATNPPEGAELRGIYKKLMVSYQQINTEKSMEYARKRISLAIPLNLWESLCDS